MRVIFAVGFVAGAMTLGACGPEAHLGDIPAPPLDGAQPTSLAPGPAMLEWRVASVAGDCGNAGLFAITGNGPGFLAAGANITAGGDRSAAVCVSTDGESWLPATAVDDSFLNSRIEGLVAAPGVTVAVGSVVTGVASDFEVRRAAVWTSADGSSWQRAPHDEIVFGRSPGEDPANGIVEMTAVAAAEQFVAAGYDRTPGHLGETWTAAIWASPDGISWTRVADEDDFRRATIHAVVPVTSGWVAVGDTPSVGTTRVAAVWTSTDGASWQRVPHDPAVFGVGRTSIAGVAAAGPGLVAVGSDRSLAPPAAAVWVSPDGTSWSRVPHDESVFGGPGLQAMKAVTAVPSRFVAVGVDWPDEGETGPAMWESADGLTWQRVPATMVPVGEPGGTWPTAVAAGPDAVVAVGRSGMIWVASLPGW